MSFIRDVRRVKFATHGHDGATIRAIAKRAGVDPSPVIQHHGTRAALFISVATWDDTTSDDVHDHLRAGSTNRSPGSHLARQS